MSKFKLFLFLTSLFINFLIPIIFHSINKPAPINTAIISKAAKFRIPSTKNQEGKGQERRILIVTVLLTAYAHFQSQWSHENRQDSAMNMPAVFILKGGEININRQ